MKKNEGSSPLKKSDEDTLFLIVTGKYFDAIRSGEKTSEYRLVTEYWVKRLTRKNWKHVIFQLGYGGDQRIRKKIVEIKLSTILHEHFGDNPVEVFEIVIE